MPIYEYACAACDTTFETLILRTSDQAEVACPTCRTPQVTRVLSRTAAHRGGAPAGGGAPSRGCGPVG